jgi:hypothetical protein
MVSPSDLVGAGLAVTVTVVVVPVIVPVPFVPVPAMIMLVLTVVARPIALEILLPFIARANPCCAFIWRPGVVSLMPNVTVV